MEGALKGLRSKNTKVALAKGRLGVSVKSVADEKGANGSGEQSRVDTK